MDKLETDSLSNSFKENPLAYLLVLEKEFREVKEFIRTLKIFSPFKLDVREATPEQKALNIAVVISYARNFKRNRGFYNTKEINAKLIKDFDTKQIELHDSIIDDRDKEFAHSDASSHDVQIQTEEFFSYSLRVVRQLLDKDQLNMLSQMVSIICKNIDKQISDLKKSIVSTQI